MKSLKRLILIVMVIMLAISGIAPAYAAKARSAKILTKNAKFYTVTGKVITLDKGDTVTVKGMKNKRYAKVIRDGEKGYVSVNRLILTKGVTGYVGHDCWAYRTNGKKVKALWGTKLNMVGRYVDKKSRVWILCTTDGDDLAYIKKSNLYK